MPRVNLPAGAYGIDIAGYKSERVRPGTHVEISDKVARLIKNNPDSEYGILSPGEKVAIKTKNGRWCQACRRLWQAWSRECPRCGAATVPEGEA